MIYTLIIYKFKQWETTMTKYVKTILVSSLGILILSGCSSKYPITFDSNPQGASIECNKKHINYTPYTIYLNKEQYNVFSQSMNECSAKWISGVKKDYKNFSIKEFPEGITQTLERPNGDGYEKDTQFALQIQKMRYQMIQAQAAAEASQQRNYQLQQQNYQLQNINNYLRYGY